MIKWKKIKRSMLIEIEEETMEKLGIPKMIPDDEKHKDDIELWKYCNFYRHKEWNKKKKYLISTFGRIFDVDKGTLHKIGYSTGYLKNAEGIRYRKVYITIDGETAAYYMHNLVAHTFLKPNKKLKDMVVDHIDENPEHNYIWNLQFVTRSQNYNLHNMRMAQKFLDEGVGIVGPDAKKYKNMITPDGKIIDTSFTDDEIRHICYMIADGHKATWIYKKLREEKPNDVKINYERIRTLYKHIMGKRHSFKEIAKECGVIFPEESGVNPYLKETGSVANTNNNTNNK